MSKNFIFISYIYVNFYLPGRDGTADQIPQTFDLQ